jgi:hypothetical protein
MVIVALRRPAADAVNVTVIVQAADGGSAATQSLVWTKSPGLAPATPTELTENGAPPLLVSVTLCGALAMPVE